MNTTMKPVRAIAVAGWPIRIGPPGIRRDRCRLPCRPPGLPLRIHPTAGQRGDCPAGGGPAVQAQGSSPRGRGSLLDQSDTRQCVAFLPTRLRERAAHGRAFGHTCRSGIRQNVSGRNDFVLLGLALFVAAYNFRRRLKTLRGLTPYEFICKCWTSEPERFILDPIHQMPGLSTWSASGFISASMTGRRRARPPAASTPSGRISPVPPWSPHACIWKRPGR